MAKKKNSDPPNRKSERNAEGLRVLRIFNEDSGELESEDVATIEVHRFGKERSTGEVGLSAVVGGIGLGYDHFETFKKVCRGRSLEFDWNAGAWLARGRIGREVATQLRDEGFQVVEREGRSNAQRLLDAVRMKLGSLTLTHHELVLVPDGFAVVQWDEFEYPCTLVDALILEDAGIACDVEAKERLARVRAAAA